MFECIQLQLQILQIRLLIDCAYSYQVVCFIGQMMPILKIQNCSNTQKYPIIPQIRRVIQVIPNNSMKKTKIPKSLAGEFKPMYPEVQNVVSFAELVLPEDIGFQELSRKIDGGRLNKKRFPAIVMRKTFPKCTVLCFHSGRLIIIGSTSEFQAELAASEAKKDMIKCLGTNNIKLRNFRITNIVANASLGFELNLGALAEQKLFVKNQKFPGLVYKGLMNVKSVLIFASGKLVFTGAKTKAQIDDAFDQLLHRMVPYAVRPVDLEDIQRQLNLNADWIVRPKYY